MNRKIVILGAGLAGLSTAYHMQNGCCIYEKEDKIGGLARTDRVNGFTFDCDGHLLHFKTSYVKKLIHNLLPGLFAKHSRNSWIFSHGVFTKYPFQANTYGLPSSVVKKCILGMCTTNPEQHDSESINLTQWMLNKFGAGITRHFMYPYNEKFWTISPDKLIPDWTENYVPRVDLKTVVNGAFSFQTKPLGYNSEFWYPKTGGIDQIAKVFSKGIKNIKTGHKIKTIDINKKIVSFENGDRAEFNDLILTTPLAALKKVVKNKLPKNVEKALSRLKFISIFNLNLGIDRENISDKHWIYFPEKKFSFFRVGFPTNFSRNAAPKGTSSLYAEVSYSESKPVNKKDICAKIESDLIKAGILKSGDKILTRYVNDIEYGYVVYDHHYRKSVSTITEFLHKNNIYPAGRFGRWRYMSMEDVILDGKITSEIINRK